MICIPQHTLPGLSKKEEVMGWAFSPYKRDCSDVGQRKLVVGFECGNKVPSSLQCEEVS